MDLPVELRSPRIGLIKIKNKDQKCFLWCHIRHINASKEHPERIKKTDKKLLKNLNAGFECNLRGFESYEGSYSIKISRSHFL